MFKRIFLFTILVVFACSQEKIGGFEQSSQEIEDQRDSLTFQRAELLARERYASEHDAELGRLISVSEQVVSGVNYKMIFESPEGDYEIVVYCQSWTNTYEIIKQGPIEESH